MMKIQKNLRFNRKKFIKNYWRRLSYSCRVYAKIDKNNITISSQLFSDDGLKSFSIKKVEIKNFLKNWEFPLEKIY